MYSFCFKCYFLTVILFSISCNNPSSEKRDSEKEVDSEIVKKSITPLFSSYRESIEAMRQNKDKSIVSKEIIEIEKRNEFKGLKYFAPDSNYLFKATFELLKPEKVLFKTSDERAPEYYRFCKIGFIKDGINLNLIGYVDHIESPESIFIPFKDATNNKTTYGGGRYIDLQYNGERTMILLDFNYAYNPYCHYNHNYSCPLVPQDNSLSIPIFAGEKKLYE